MRIDAAAKHGRHRSSLFLWLATAGAVAYSLVISSLPLIRISTAPIGPGRAAYAAAALACCLPLQAWLVRSVCRGDTGRRQLLALAALASVVIGMLPLVGIAWLGTFALLAGLVLICPRPPLSFLLFGALIATPAPLALVFGHPELATHFTLTVAVSGLPLAVGVWLLRMAWQLQAGRLELAEEAIVRERLRIDGELSRTVGTALQAITLQGHAVAELTAADPASARRELRVLAALTRRTLSDARRMVTRYRETSLHAELETALALLSAAGVEAALVSPSTELPDAVDDGLRDALRRDVAALLGDGRPGMRVAVTCDGAGVRLQVLR